MHLESSWALQIEVLENVCREPRYAFSRSFEAEQAREASHTEALAVHAEIVLAVPWIQDKRCKLAVCEM